MHGLLEFVFEGISPDQLARVVIDSVGQEENVGDATQDGSALPPDAVLDPGYLTGIASTGESAGCSINLRSLRMDGKLVQRATLQVIHYDGKNDLSVLLASTDCLNADLSSAEEFYQWAKSVSERYEIENFYGGLEPAFDGSTQLYSKGRIGPVLKL